MAKEKTNKKKTNKVAEATENNKKSSNKTNQSKRKKTSQNQIKNNKSTKTAKKNLTNTKNNKKKAKPSKESLAAQKQIDKIFSKNSELVKLIKIVAIVTAVMGVFYIITLIATNQIGTSSEESEETSTTTATEIQYDYIMIGTMLNKKGTYYVLIEEDEDLRLSEYDTLIEMASANEDGPTIYRANLTDSFNKGYLSKEANYDSDDISDFRVTGTTLVKVVDGSIDTVYDTYDEIKEKLSALAE